MSRPGGIVGEVVSEPGSATYFQKKHIGNVKYSEFTVRLPAVWSPRPDLPVEKPDAIERPRKGARVLVVIAASSEAR